MPHRSTPATPLDPLNLAVLRGVVAADPDHRDLPSGEHVVQFDLITCAPDSSRVTVPVSWSNPAASILRRVGAGTDIVVTGWVRRRFFRVNGQTQSRTEVVARRVTPSGGRRAVATMFAEVVAALEVHN